MACFIILNFRKTIYKSKLRYDCTTNGVEHYQKCLAENKIERLNKRLKISYVGL